MIGWRRLVGRAPDARRRPERQTPNSPITWRCRFLGHHGACPWCHRADGYGRLSDGPDTDRADGPSTASTAQIMPIVHTCRRMSISQNRRTVIWTVLFPTIPACTRWKRAWYDTILGGTGTVLGLDNMIGNEITASKLSSTGTYTRRGMERIAGWMPTSINGQLQNVHLWQASYGISYALWNTSDDVMINMTAWMNWTDCALQHIHALVQKERMQRILTTDNPWEWRSIWNISSGVWLHVFGERTRCNSSMCYGIWKEYNVTDVHPVCRFHVLPIIVDQHFLELQVKGEWLDPYHNVTYDLTDCDNTDKGFVCTTRTGYVNPCLKEENALCDWKHLPSKDVLVEIGPHTLCVATLHSHPQLPTTPYSGCLFGVHVWSWHNQTFRLTNYTIGYALTKVQWKVLRHPWIGISLERLRCALSRSTDLKHMIENHSHNMTRLQMSTLVVSGQVKAIAKQVEQSSAHSFWDMFSGWSSTAKQVMAPPLVVLIVILLMITLCNVFTCLYIRRIRGDLMQIIYHAR